MTPKYRLILWWPPPPQKKKKKKNIHKIFMPKKYSFFWKPEKQLKFKILNPNNYPRLRIY